jgi:hypothetical protein
MPTCANHVYLSIGRKRIITSQHRIVASDHSILGLICSDPRRIHLTDEKRLLSSEAELSVRVAARGELQAKVIGQDRVILHVLGKWRLIGPPEADLHPSLERLGRRYRIRVPIPQGKEASACQRHWRQDHPTPQSLTEFLGDPMVHPKAFPIGGHLINQFHPVPTVHR